MLRYPQVWVFELPQFVSSRAASSYHGMTIILKDRMLLFDWILLFYVLLQMYLISTHLCSWVSRWRDGQRELVSWRKR